MRGLIFIHEGKFVTLCLDTKQCSEITIGGKIVSANFQCVTE